MKSIQLFTVILGLAATASLHSTPITYLASADGINATADYSFSATGGSAVLGYKNSTYFAGVKGGAGGTEIDVNQSLTVNFAAAERLASLSFALLFNGPEYNDTKEIAEALTSAGDVYQLRVVGENLASWYKNNSFVASVIGIGTALNGPGRFTIDNPFGMAFVTSIKLAAVNNNPPKGGSNSDFGLFGFTTAAVPDTNSTLSLMGAAILTFAIIARRSCRR
jgi:hypothetical protein